MATQRELYRLLVDQLPGTTIGLVDERLTWVDVAGRELANLELDPTEMIGRRVGSTLAEESRAPLEDLLRRGFDGPVSGVVESEAGTSYEIDAMPFRNDERRDLVLVVARDSPRGAWPSASGTTSTAPSPTARSGSVSCSRTRRAASP